MCGGIWDSDAPFLGRPAYIKPKPAKLAAGAPDSESLVVKVAAFQSGISKVAVHAGSITDAPRAARSSNLLEANCNFWAEAACAPCALAVQLIDA